jgi:hypothetical protein
VAQFYLPVSGAARPAGAAGLLYRPAVLGCAEVGFLDKRRNLQHRLPHQLLAKPPAPGQTVNWSGAGRVADTLAAAPEAGAHWAAVPESLNSARKLKALEKTFADFLYDNAKLTVLENSKLGLVGQPGEDVLAFRERCRTAAHQEAEKALAAETSKYQAKFEALGARLPEVGAGAEKAGASLLDYVNPLKWLSWSLSAKPASLERPRGKEAAVRRLEGEWHARVAGLFEKWKQIGEEYAEVQLTPRRADVQVTRFGLAWAPFWQVVTDSGPAQLVPAWR